MARRTSVHSKGPWVCSIVVLALLFLVAVAQLGVFAQAERSIPQPTPSKELNKAGEQEYKLISVVYRWQSKSASSRRQYFVPVAILKLDEVQYEYAWFQTTSNSLVTIDGFASKFDESSKRGFRLANRFLIYSHCDAENVLGMIGKDVMGRGGACRMRPGLALGCTA